MRFFRIPGFTGIEAHRDDADRGSLRVVEGCLPHGPGGLRSGPVWKKVGEVSSYSTSDVNQVSANDDGQGNSLVLVSRNCEIRDMVLISNENTNITSFGESYDVALPEGSLYSLDNATISSVGNRLYAVGDGSQEAMYIGKGPAQADSFEVYPDETLYKQEWSRFPKCKYYARGPKGSLFASGNPDKPLTVYISEPPGLTSSIKDSPYSTEDSVYNAGRLSTVEILGSDASKITALSTRGDQVVVHTDKGSYLLYAPSGDQASTGYRVEQAPATNFSAAINQQVVSGESGTQTFWVGHDGQVYKDESASRGSADLRSKADEDQANWKSKGVWEHERPVDLSNSFATFEAQTGNYVFYLEEKNYDPLYAPPLKPLQLESSTKVEFNTHYKLESGPWIGITELECEDPHKICWSRTNENLAAGYIVSSTSILGSNSGRCCSDAGAMDCCYFPDPHYKIDNCECVIDTSHPPQFETLTECEAQLLIDCPPYTYNLNGCEPCIEIAGDAGTYTTHVECENARINACQKHALSDSCACEPDSEGVFNNLFLCEEYAATNCEAGSNRFFQVSSQNNCCEPGYPQGYLTEEECKAENPDYGYTFLFCSKDGGAGAYNSCEPVPEDYNYRCNDQNSIDCHDCPDLFWDVNQENCICEKNLRAEQGDGHLTEEDCIAALATTLGCETYNLVGCDCLLSEDATGQYTLEECNAQKALDSTCDLHWLVNCECTSTDPGNGLIAHASLAACESAKEDNVNCQQHWVNNCNCETTDPGDGNPPYSSFYDCIEHINTDFPLCFCEDDSTDYFLDGLECVFMGGGGGTHTECDCIREGRTILE